MSQLSSGVLARDPCRICRYPSWTEVPGDEDETYELVCSNFDDLRLSSANSCLGCAVLVQAWEYGTPAADERTKEYITFNRCSGNLYVHLFKGSRGVLNIDVFTVSHMPRFKHIRLAALIPLSTSLAENLPTILQWLEACEKRHGTCSTPTDYVPPRLLDLENSSPDVVRLVELERLQMSSRNKVDIKFDLRYACLSHCWGETRFKHLTRGSNLAANCEGIPILGLPQTFRDAVAISRALSIRYLWIDSLCIVQDDHADWRSHVNKMAQIYNNACLTLAAGTSRDDAGGFFQQTTLPFSSPSSFKLLDGKMEYKIYIRKCLPHPDENWPAGPEMPLMSRGWVFQERLLSRRFLCFAANEVLWECLEDVACSCSTTVDGFKQHGQSENPGFLNCPPSKFEYAKIEGLPREDLWSLWRELVTQYTRRELTYPDDKLPALAGLARNFQAANAGDYAHGMWVDCIEKDMLWQNHGYSNNEFRPRKAPSWSWVSAADGGIEWERNFQVSSMEVISLMGEAREDDQIDGASRVLLHLRGPVTHICLHREDVVNGMEVYQGYRCCSVNKWTMSDDHLGTTSESMLGTSRTSSTFENTLPSGRRRILSPIAWPPGVKVIEAQQNRGQFWTDYKFWSDEENLWYTLNDVIFLDLGIENDFVPCGYERPDFCWAAGLILRYCDRELDGTAIYERIGWLRFCTGKPRSDWKPAGPVTQILIA